MTGDEFGLWLASQAAAEPLQGGPAMDAKSYSSGHLMLITPERVFYAGLLRRPRERCLGAFHLYVSIKGGLRCMFADGREGYGELTAYPPNMRHTIASDPRSALTLVIEPKSAAH